MLLFIETVEVFELKVGTNSCHIKVKFHVEPS